MAGIVLLAFIGWACARGSEAFRKITLDLLLLMLALAFFGVDVDMLHIALPGGARADFAFGVLEDGGEMLVASLMLWYVFLLAVREERAAVYRCDHLPLRRQEFSRFAHARARRYASPACRGVERRIECLYPERHRTRRACIAPEPAGPFPVPGEPRCITCPGHAPPC